MQDRCYHCSFGLQMPDGHAWCQITVTPRNICSEYSYGSSKIYKPDKIVLPKKNFHVKAKEIKPIPITKPISTVKRSKKAPSQQQKLF